MKIQGEITWGLAIGSEGVYDTATGLAGGIQVTNSCLYFIGPGNNLGRI